VREWREAGAAMRNTHYGRVVGIFSLEFPFYQPDCVDEGFQKNASQNPKMQANAATSLFAAAFSSILAGSDQVPWRRRTQ
jgi:hypothetical protein